MTFPPEQTKKAVLLNDILFEMYGNQGWWPITPTPGRPPVYDPDHMKRDATEREGFEIVVGSVLAQHTSWANAVKAIMNLTRQHLLDAGIMAAADHRLETAIRPAGYYNQKAGRLREIAGRLLEIGGVKALTTLSTPRLRALLLSWRGVGPETADCILCYALKRPVFVADNYTKRLFGNLGLPSNTYQNMQDFIHQSIPASASGYGDLHARIVAVFSQKGLETLYRKGGTALCRMALIP